MPDHARRPASSTAPHTGPTTSFCAINSKGYGGQVVTTVATPDDIAIWFSGYYNGSRNNTVFDSVPAAGCGGYG
jgi:hypothetical protein